MIRNTETRFGATTRLLHWATAVLILVTIPLGLWIANVQPTLDTLWLFGAHKTIGITVLGLTALRLVWHLWNPPPAPISEGVPRWQLRAAHLTHRILYVVVIALPLTGWIASSATGIDTVVFGRWTLPRIAPVSERWEATAFAFHGLLAAVLVLALVLHVSGALHRALGRRDGTLSRMLSGRTPE